MNAIQFADKNSTRNEAVIVADHGSSIEVRRWINCAQRWRPYTEMVQKRWVRKQIRLSGLQINALKEVA